MSSSSSSSLSSPPTLTLTSAMASSSTTTAENSDATTSSGTTTVQMMRRTTTTKGTTSSGTVVTLAVCTLNQWALDFDGNRLRILQSCREAEAQGADYRLGPELEICGYGCEDHFLESDLWHHCWETLAWLLWEEGVCDSGMIGDFGMPVLHCGVLYNCRVLCQHRQILLIRPKVCMAEDGNYRESRYFSPYTSAAEEEDVFCLPPPFCQYQATCPFGTRPMVFRGGISLGCETCEELWSPASPHVGMTLETGVDIIGNGSGSHHELRKLHRRLELVCNATLKCGGVYLYSNQQGCDGGRCYYDGSSLIVLNGQVLAQSPQFSIDQVQVHVATVDLRDVHTYRASIGCLQKQAAGAAVAGGALQQGQQRRRLLETDRSFGQTATAQARRRRHLTQPLEQLEIPTPPEECCLGPACWLWDYLRRTRGARGYFLPLSGGADSSSTATIVAVMCRLVWEQLEKDPSGSVAADVRRVTQNDALPTSAHDLCRRLFVTTYMSTAQSSEATRDRALRLAQTIGSRHYAIPLDSLVTALVALFALVFGASAPGPRFASEGGTRAQDVALQNVQARLRMVLAYLLAQLMPLVHTGGSGFLLVLGSSNVDEGLRGYVTKYDCSSADVNPIGAISKLDLRRMLLDVSEKYEWPILEEVARAEPTAELQPPGQKQVDEEDMGMTYEELGLFGRLRKLEKCGPVAMFSKLCHIWTHLPPSEVAAKVKRFFYHYSANRHKMCTMTPSYHAEGYSPDDNRFDFRPFLYNTEWTRQFQAIDEMVAEMETPETMASNEADREVSK